VRDEVQDVPLGCTHFSYNLDTKRRIFDKAISIPKNVWPTARKFSVQPTEIRIWKRKFTGSASFHPTTGTGISTATPEGESLPRKCFKKEGLGLQFDGGGRKCALQKDVTDKFLVFYDGKRFADLGIALRLMTAECRLFDPSICLLSSKLLRVVLIGCWSSGMCLGIMGRTRRKIQGMIQL
jgi:hypothetical protein